MNEEKNDDCLVESKNTKEKKSIKQYFSNFFKKESGKVSRRKLSFGEELGNSLTHGIPAILDLIMMPIVYIYCFEHADPDRKYFAISGIAIFCISIFLMFMTSTLYHAMKDESKHQEVMHILDHCMIFVAIAGTYTPIALYTIGGIEGYIILVVQWLAVILGVLYKTCIKTKVSKATTIIYLIMGWTIAWFLPQFIKGAPAPMWWLIFAGGICYSIGTIFYSHREWRYSHMIWHLFIDVASICQFIGVCFFMY